MLAKWLKEKGERQNVPKPYRILQFARLPIGQKTVTVLTDKEHNSHFQKRESVEDSVAGQMQQNVCGAIGERQ